MTVVVTGASGFVGRHVVRRLAALGITPKLVVRPGSVVPADLADHPVVEMDIGAAPSDAFERLGAPTDVIHLAWDGLPNYASTRHLEEELPAQGSFLEGLVGAGLQGLTVAGTCLEYGLQSGELSEDIPTAPVTAYGKAKDELRAALQRLQGTRSFRLTWARLFYLFGEGQAPGALVPQLEAAISRGDATFDMSGGEQLRDYLPIEVAASDLVALAVNGRDNGVVNICSGQPIAVRKLAEKVVQNHGASIALNLGHFPYPDYEPMAFWGDRAKLDHCLRRDR